MAITALSVPFVRKMRPYVHPRAVVPEKERLVVFHGAAHEIERAAHQLAFDGLHADLGRGVHSGTAVDDRLFADLAPARINGGIVLGRRLGSTMLRGPNCAKAGSLGERRLPHHIVRKFAVDRSGDNSWDRATRVLAAADQTQSAHGQAPTFGDMIEMLNGRGTTHQMALHGIAGFSPQEAQFSLRLDAFGDHRQIQPAS